jgi:DUF917 family protein
VSVGAPPAAAGILCHSVVEVFESKGQLLSSSTGSRDRRRPPRVPQAGSAVGRAWEMRHSALPPFALGAELFGAGGGGSTRAMTLAAASVLGNSESVSIAPPEDLPASDWVLPVGLVGSVTVLEEMLPSGNEWAEAIRQIERYCGVAASALMPFEAAGVNALMPIIACRSLELPMIDADLMGRAFTGLNQTVLSLVGRTPAPLCLANDRGELVLLDHMGPDQAERYARSAVVEMGGWAAASFAPMRAGEVAQEAIPLSVSRLLAAGHHLEEGRLGPLLDEFAGRRLLRGRVVEIERSQDRGYGRGSIAIESFSDDRLLTIEFQNESVVAVESGTVVAVAPDLICALVADDLAVVATEQFAYGMELEVICLPADPQWRRPGADAVVGPQAFGYEPASVLASGDGTR